MINKEIIRVNKALEKLQNGGMPPFLLGEIKAYEQLIEIKSLLTDYIVLLNQIEQINKAVQPNGNPN